MADSEHQLQSITPSVQKLPVKKNVYEDLTVSIRLL